MAFLTSLIACTLLLGTSNSLFAADALVARTALDDYVEKPDDSFSWKVISKKRLRA